MSSSGGGENDSTRGPRIVESLSDIADALEESVEVKDRKYRNKMYKHSFLGSDACDCLLGFLRQIDESSTRQHAIQCGRDIVTRYRLFDHVCNDHIFQDDYLMYRFTPQSERRVPTKEDEENDRDYFTRLLENDHNIIVEDQLQVESSQEIRALAFMADMFSPSDDTGSARHKRRSWGRPSRGRRANTESPIREEDPERSSGGFSAIRGRPRSQSPGQLDRMSSTSPSPTLPESSKGKGRPRSHSPGQLNRASSASSSPRLSKSARVWWGNHKFQSPWQLNRKSSTGSGPGPSGSSSPSSIGSSGRYDGKSIISVEDFDDADLEATAVAFEAGVEVKTHRYRGEVFKETFVGESAVAFLASYLGVKRDAALQIGNELMSRFNLFEHVTKDHELEDDYYFYWFVDPSERRQLYPTSNTSPGGLESLPMAPLSVSTLDDIAAAFEKSVKVGDHRYRLKIHKDCFIGEEAVSYLVLAKFARSRLDAVELGRKLAARFNLFEHVAKEHVLEDDHHFYQFIDKGQRRVGQGGDTDELFKIDGIDSVSLLQKAADSFRECVIVKTHVYHFKRYHRTFVGCQAVDYLVHSSLAATRKDAITLGRRLALELNLFRHVTDAHEFKDDHHLYHYTDSDTSSIGNSSVSSLTSTYLEQIAKDMRKNVKVKNRRWYHKVYKNCFLGYEAVSYLVKSGVAPSREDAVIIGRKLEDDLQLFEHVERDHILEDRGLFYRFLDPRKTEANENSEQIADLKRTAENLEAILEVKDRRYRFQLYRNVFLGSDAVSFLAAMTKTREDAVQLGRKLAKTFNLFHHVTDVHELCDGELFYRFTHESARWRWVEPEEEDLSSDEDFSSDEDLIEWKARLEAFETRVSSSRDSLQSNVQPIAESLDTPTRLKIWASQFRRLDPRYRILTFFTEVAQLGVDDLDDGKGIDLSKVRPILWFLFCRVSVFTVWRPTSFEAIKKMMLGQAVGKGLDIKGKSAKRGKHSAYVPFLQIGENKHKSLVRTLSKESTVRIFFATSKARNAAAYTLENECTEMVNTLEEAKKIIADPLTDRASREEAKEMLLNEMTDPTIESLDDYAPKCYGLEVPIRLFWETFVGNRDCTRVPGSEYCTGRPSTPAFQDMNNAAVSAKPRKDRPRAVLWQSDDKSDPIHPLGLLMAYEENGRVVPVVSDFDPFLVGTRRVPFHPEKGSLPEDQVEILKWSVDRIEDILDEQGPENWTSRWLKVLKEETSKGFYPKIPQFGFGDPRSYSMMANAVQRLTDDGAVRHGSECFNYFFPQELDEELLVVSTTFDGLPWRYMDPEGLQSFLSERVDESFTFPLNPKWILCDPGWKDLYDKLLASDNETVQNSMEIWYPKDSGIREKIEEIHRRHPHGFERERKDIIRQSKRFLNP